MAIELFNFKTGEFIGVMPMKPEWGGNFFFVLQEVQEGKKLSFEGVSYTVYSTKTGSTGRLIVRVLPV